MANIDRALFEDRIKMQEEGFEPSNSYETGASVQHR